MDIDEHLPRYFDALGGPTLSKIVKQEISMRKINGYRTIMDSTLIGILNATTGGKTIVGVGFYDMLFNDKYKERFQFFHSIESKQASIEYDCIKVKQALSIAFEKGRTQSILDVESSWQAERKSPKLNENYKGKLKNQFYTYFFILKFYWMIFKFRVYF